MWYAYTVDTFNLKHIKVLLGISKLAHNSKTAYHKINGQKVGIWGIYVVAIWVLFDLAPVEVILALVCALFPVKCTVVHYVTCVHCIFSGMYELVVCRMD